MIHPVIICGGSGSRLWPLSRKSYPKQFVHLLGNKTLFQQSAERLSGNCFAAPTIVTNSDFRFIVVEQLKEIGIKPGAILIEPEIKNTAAAILAATLYLKKTSPKALILVAPSDHNIEDTDHFLEKVLIAKPLAEKCQIVTFGIKPTRPETGYGYLKISNNSSLLKASKLAAFVEKPNKEMAEEMFKSCSYLWNAGIFLFSIPAILKEYELHYGELILLVQNAIDLGNSDLGFFRLHRGPWAKIKDVSIDYAIMERSDNLMVVPFECAWSDLGDWNAVWKESAINEESVVTHGNVTAINCQNSLIRSESPDLEVVGIGLENIVVVGMKDAVLVTNKSDSQKVKTAVVHLNQKKIKQGHQASRDHRPWGWFESLVITKQFQVKRITVNPKAALSLQSHKHRAEHWIVVEGVASVTIDQKVMTISVNESVFIPKGSVHRMENPGNCPMVLIEVQTGTYFGEDDIIRYDDVYSRTED